MNLRGQAKLDLSITLQDGMNGFGLPVILNDGTHSIGNDVDNPFFGQVGRVSFFIDPDTGLGVAGSFAHIAVNLSQLKNAGFIVDSRSLSKKDWKINTADITGVIQSYTIKSFLPDFTLGVLVIICDELIMDNSTEAAILTTILQNIGVL